MRKHGYLFRGINESQKKSRGEGRRQLGTHVGLSTKKDIPLCPKAENRGKKEASGHRGAPTLHENSRRGALSCKAMTQCEQASLRHLWAPHFPFDARILYKHNGHPLSLSHTHTLVKLSSCFNAGSTVLWKLRAVPSGSPPRGCGAGPLRSPSSPSGHWEFYWQWADGSAPASLRPRDLCWEANAGNKVPPCLLIRGRWQGVASQTKRGRCRAEQGRRLFCHRLKSILMIQALLMKNVMLPA